MLPERGPALDASRLHLDRGEFNKYTAAHGALRSTAGALSQDPAKQCRDNGVAADRVVPFPNVAAVMLAMPDAAVQAPSHGATKNGSAKPLYCKIAPHPPAWSSGASFVGAPRCLTP